MISPSQVALTKGGIRKLAHLPRSAILVVCLYLLGWGIFTLFQNVLLSFGDETALRVIHVYLVDLNGDDHQDAYMVTNQMHYILLNGGSGDFTLNRELLMHNYAFALGDLDGNGSLDAILTRFENGMMGGDLLFECAEVPDDVVIPTSAEGVPHQVFAIRDGNRDGLPEGYIAGCCGGGTTMMNYATLFSNTRSCVGTDPPHDAALGDLNGDGALDVFIAKDRTRDQRTTPNEVWFNDGRGNFSNSGQRLGDAESYAVALGDLNGDGFLEAVVGNRNGAEIWFNNGQGDFTKGSQHLGRGMTNIIFITDLDNDGDLDLFLGGYTSIRVWLNDGAGQFKSGQQIKFGRYEALTVGEVTGDGIVDIFVGGPESYQVWRGNGKGRFNALGYSMYR